MMCLRIQFERTQLGPTGKEIRNICEEGLEYNTVQHNTINRNVVLDIVLLFLTSDSRQSP
jgi:hypothetical protein